MRLAYHANTWGPMSGSLMGITSIKDLTYRSEHAERAIADIGAAGYEGVELFDGNVLDYEGREDELAALAAGAGVQLLAVYCGANLIFADARPEELWKIDRACAAAAKAGAEHLVIGAGARRAGGPTAADYDALGRGLDEVADVAARHGLTPSYHPHLTTLAEAPEELDRVMERTRIGLCPDIAHIAAGGGDPVAVVERYAGRIPYVHLKDLRPDPFAFMALGKGQVDVEGVVRRLRDAGYDGWLCVELDETDGAPAQEARHSRSVLEGLLGRA